MSNLSYEGTVHIADGEVVILHLADNPNTGIESDQVSTEPQQFPVVKELTESTTADNLGVTVFLLAAVALTYVTERFLHRN